MIELPEDMTAADMQELSRKVDAGTIELDVRTDSSRKSGMVFTVTEIAEPSRIDVDQAAKALGELTETLQREQQDGGGL